MWIIHQDIAILFGQNVFVLKADFAQYVLWSIKRTGMAITKLLKVANFGLATFRCFVIAVSLYPLQSWSLLIIIFACIRVEQHCYVDKILIFPFLTFLSRSRPALLQMQVFMRCSLFSVRSVCLSFRLPSVSILYLIYQTHYLLCTSTYKSKEDDARISGIPCNGYRHTSNICYPKFFYGYIFLHKKPRTVVYCRSNFWEEILPSASSLVHLCTLVIVLTR